ncbi:zinc transport system permease protein [Geothermobacter ehrlichii]|uniref:High-affinity zinc uptake system membrane protein ZnuB n=1 Tax=Geothermobacter ehrlichii TaxID=213224 RepID=A0A5D3WNE0_9BACT|nr:iron chelate uptake ABC transporter family permease subunit [Geothermobacter ehrlichii]TYO99179.1 zinc transport system permease protein [Geothermobacter ehrlichii]
MDDFMLRALAGGLGVALVAGPYGSFIVWRRLAYFGDTLAHAALLGIAGALFFDLAPLAGVTSVCLLLALLLFLLQRQGRLAGDTLLGILSHTALALGLVVLSFMEEVRVDLLGYLFGDILATSGRDLWWIYLGGGTALLLLWRLWRPLLCLTADEDLARVEGVRVDLVKALFLLMLALVVAILMKIVGLILVTALLIIPAAAARQWTASPESMGAAASVIGMLAVAGGLTASWHWDTPAGPSIVLTAGGLFLLSLLRRRR